MSELDWNLTVTEDGRRVSLLCIPEMAVLIKVALPKGGRAAAAGRLPASNKGREKEGSTLSVNGPQFGKWVKNSAT